METSNNILPPSTSEVKFTPKSDVPPDDVESPTPTGGKTFKAALARLESHRTKVQWSLAVCLIARLVLELHLQSVVQSTQIVAAVPLVGMTLLAYMIVLWFLATRTRDRFGFGMALGIGVLVMTYQIGMAATLRPFSVATAWPALVIALTHLALAFTAFRASYAFPPFDGKRPWIVGFVTALVFVVIPWVAPAVQDMIRR